VELHEAYAHLNRAKNEITRLQSILDWLNQDGSDRATSHPTTPSQSTPRRSSASRSASSPGFRDRTPDSSPNPSPPRGTTSAPASTAPTRRMNTRSQVDADNNPNPRTLPPALFSPQRAPPATRARGQQRNASKPAGVSKKKEKAKTKRGRK
jgi:hypothetical protein